MTKLNERLLTLEEVCQYFRVSRTALWHWRQAGKIVALKTPGGSLRFREADVHEVLQEEATPVSA